MSTGWTTNGLSASHSVISLADGTRSIDMHDTHAPRTTRAVTPVIRVRRTKRRRIPLGPRNFCAWQVKAFGRFSLGLRRVQPTCQPKRRRLVCGRPLVLGGHLRKSCARHPRGGGDVAAIGPEVDHTRCPRSADRVRDGLVVRPIRSSRFGNDYVVERVAHAVGYGSH